MKPFEYIQADSPNEAVSFLNEEMDTTKILAGGMDLLTELKEEIIEPKRLVSIGEIESLQYIRLDNGTLRIGAATTLTEIANHKAIQESFTVLADAASVVGSPQIRNRGTLGGNLCQRPRCWYYRGEAYHCLKKGGDFCYAVSGRNKYHAILGGAPCFIVHPSDCAPALIALSAKVHILGPDGSREAPLEECFVLPEDDVFREIKIEPNEIITEVEIPPNRCKSVYIKFREKDDFDWSLSSVAAALELDGSRCKKASLVLGGVATIPWRAKEAESLLAGKTITESLALEAGEAAVVDAIPLDENAYKIPLTKALVKQAIMNCINH